jgi:hypothetical protein
LLDESNDLLLRLPIDLDEPEYSVILAVSLLSLAFYFEPLKVFLSLISASPDLLILLLHVFDFREYAVDLLVDLGELSQQIHWITLFVQKGACHGLDLTLGLGSLIQLGQVGTQMLIHIAKFVRKILGYLFELLELCLALV